MDFEKVINTWREAANDLEIKIQIPFVLSISDKLIRFELHLEDFGSELGTIIFSMHETTELNIAKSCSYYCSALNPETHSIYEREYFIDMLNDWGFFGKPDEKPSWHTGQPWT